MQQMLLLLCGERAARCATATGNFLDPGRPGVRVRSPLRAILRLQSQEELRRSGGFTSAIFEGGKVATLPPRPICPRRRRRRGITKAIRRQDGRIALCAAKKPRAIHGARFARVCTAFGTAGENPYLRFERSGVRAGDTLHRPLYQKETAQQKGAARHSRTHSRHTL